MSIGPYKKSHYAFPGQQKTAIQDMVNAIEQSNADISALNSAVEDMDTDRIYWLSESDVLINKKSLASADVPVGVWNEETIALEADRVLIDVSLRFRILVPGSDWVFAMMEVVFPSVCEQTNDNDVPLVAYPYDSFITSVAGVRASTFGYVSSPYSVYFHGLGRWQGWVDVYESSGVRKVKWQCKRRCFDEAAAEQALPAGWTWNNISIFATILAYQKG